MKSNRKYSKVNLRFLVVSLGLFFSLSTIAQKNITTIRINGEVIKKRTVVDPLAEWMSKSDLKKADSCIQVIFNAVHRKDTAAGITGVKGLQTLVNSEKYAAESKKPTWDKVCCIFKDFLKCCMEPINPYPDKIKVLQ